MRNTDSEDQNKLDKYPETQTETSGVPPIPPIKTAVGCDSGDNRSFSFDWPFPEMGTRKWWLGFLIDQRLHGISWGEISSEHLQCYSITREEIDEEVKRRGGNVS